MTPRKNIFDSIAFWILAGTLFSMPVFFLPASIVSFGTAKLAFLSIGVILAFVCYVIERMRQGSISIPWSPWYALLVLVPISYLVSSLLGAHAYKSLVGGLFEQDTFHTITICFILVGVLMFVASSAKRVYTLLLAVSAAVCLVALVQVVRIVGGASFSLGVLGSPAFSLAGSWNDLTSLVILGVGMAVIALETMVFKKWVKISLAATIVVAFFFVTLSIGNFMFDLYFVRFSLPVLLSFIALIIFAYMFSLSRAKQGAVENSVSKGQGVIYGSLIVLVLSITLVVFGGPLHSFLSAKTGVVYAVGQPNWGPTYGVAAEVIKQKPFFGSGPNSFAYEWNLHKPLGFNELPFWNTSFAYGIGIIPSSIVTVGVVGFILWLLFYGFVIMSAFRLLFRGEKSGIAPVKLMVSFGALFTTFLMLFSAPGLIVEVMHFTFIGLLFALDIANKKSKAISFEKKQWQHFLAILASIVMLIAVMFWVYEIGQKVAASYFANQAIAKSANEDQALQSMMTALRLDPSQAVYSQLVAQIYASKVAKMSALPAAEVEAKKDELKASITAVVNYSTVAERIDPTDFTAPIASGRLFEFLGTLGVPGAYDQAIAKYNAAASIASTNPLPLIFAANAALAMDNTKASQDYLIRALKLKSNYSDSQTLAKGIADMINQINKSGVQAPAVTDEDSEDSSTATTTKK